MFSLYTVAGPTHPCKLQDYSHRLVQLGGGVLLNQDLQGDRKSPRQVPAIGHSPLDDLAIPTALVVVKSRSGRVLSFCEDH